VNRARHLDWTLSIILFLLVARKGFLNASQHCHPWPRIDERLKREAGAVLAADGPHGIWAAFSVDDDAASLKTRGLSV